MPRSAIIAAADHSGGLSPAVTMGSPSARRYSSSLIASTDRIA
jgi:hypothetical protein